MYESIRAYHMLRYTQNPQIAKQKGHALNNAEPLINTNAANFLQRPTA